jgi:hypothetical protein
MPYVERRLKENEAQLDTSLAERAMQHMASLGLIVKGEDGKWVRVGGRFESEEALMGLLQKVRGKGRFGGERGGGEWEVILCQGL